MRSAIMPWILCEWKTGDDICWFIGPNGIWSPVLVSRSCVKAQRIHLATQCCDMQLTLYFHHYCNLNCCLFSSHSDSFGNPDALLSFYDIFCSAVYAFDFDFFYFYFCRSLIPFEQDKVSKKMTFTEENANVKVAKSSGNVKCIVSTTICTILCNFLAAYHHSPFIAICQCDYETNEYVNEWVQKL